MNILAPSVLSADFSTLGNDIKAVVDAGAQWIHLDVMDGMFVPNISFGMPVIGSVRKVTDAFFDVHLMINEPIRYIDEFVANGADMITVHYEACENVSETLDKIREKGVKAGLAISPDTEVSLIEPYVNDVDMVLVMSVYPGFGGQKFIEASIDRLNLVREITVKVGKPDMYIQVDGGIGLNNVKEVCNAGANVIVAGSAVFKGNKEENVRGFLQAIR